MLFLSTIGIGDNFDRRASWEPILSNSLEQGRRGGSRSRQRVRSEVDFKASYLFSRLNLSSCSTSEQVRFDHLITEDFDQR
jgi:hypothetical protein